MSAERPPSIVPPHVRSHTGRSQLDRTLLVATLPVVLVSIGIHGADAALLYASATIAAMVGAGAWRYIAKSADSASWSHAAAVGVLLTMMLPAAEAPWRAALGGLMGVTITHALRHRFETYVWHPAVMAWLLLCYVIPGQPAAPRGGPDIAQIRPVDWIAQAYAIDGGGVAQLREAALYDLPPWETTLFGHTAGGVGEVCGLAILAAGVWLIFAHRLRWQAPVAALVGAAVIAAIWPIRAADGSLVWLPIAVTADGFPIGATLVLYHLTGGGLLLAGVFMSADSLSTPLNSRGHALFGGGLGALTVAFRALGIAPGACWWALLALNSLVPVINRLTRRRVWGT